MFSDLLHNFFVMIQLEQTYTVVLGQRWVDQCPRCEHESAGPTHSRTGRKESGGPVPGRASENPSSLSAQKRRAGGLRGWSVGVGFCLNFSRVLEVRPPGHYRPAGPRGPGGRGITQRHTMGRRHLRFKPTLILLLELKGISRSLLFREDGKETFL